MSGANAARLGLYGGSFDPPHRGHVELARRAKEKLGLDRLLVLVSADPGHKLVETPAEVRLRLARAAFPDDDVELDEHARTIDALRAHPEWDGAVFLIGADQFADFLSWQEPDDVLRHVPIAVATRPGFPRERLDGVLAQLEAPERVSFFEIEPTPAASRELRQRLVDGDEVRDQLPEAVADLVEAEGLYRHGPRLHSEQLSPIEQARRIAAIAGDKLAHDVVILDMRPVCTYTDYFVVCTGNNARQTKGIWDDVHGRLKAENRLLPRSVEGERESTWIIADYLDVVLHVFTPEARQFYRLEDLWDDVPHETLEAASA